MTGNLHLVIIECDVESVLQLASFPAKGMGASPDVRRARRALPVAETTVSWPYTHCDGIWCAQGWKTVFLQFLCLQFTKLGYKCRALVMWKVFRDCMPHDVCSQDCHLKPGGIFVSFINFTDLWRREVRGKFSFLLAIKMLAKAKSVGFWLGYVDASASI